ncbi:MAG: helix-turn-helix transcriptional regulator [Methanomassiliicoccales archaeon]|nr:MAG: helix-turn-helix transcriptional regulator [Methanomassiliicoccales archaeon]
MSFEITVVSNTPLTPIDDLDEVTLTFLSQIGYIPKGYDPKTGTTDVLKSVPYRLFSECLLGHPEKGWLVEELANELDTTKPTIYRHINKLKDMDILEEIHIESGEAGHRKKAYRIRYGNLSKAWNFVDAHLEVAIDNYRKTVDHMQNLVEKRRKRK